MAIPQTQLPCSLATEAAIPGATISRPASPLVMELVSEESHAPMNLNDKAIKPLESNLVSSQERPEETPSRVRVEPCEFERLLQRAMEILSIRARRATASRS
jgi:hypothetical protein